MATFAVVDRTALDGQLTLAPERYQAHAPEAISHVCIGDVATFSAASVRAKTAGSFVCIDTTHAVDGFISARPLAVTGTLASAKKQLEHGDVIISRLRPYLRQIAFVDQALVEMFEGSQLCCSTEFYVLRPASALSLAFLVPFLLGDRVQSVLAGSQEGGHHPRVPAQILARLPIPGAFVEDRLEVSAAFSAVIAAYRNAERAREALIARKT